MSENPETAVAEQEVTDLEASDTLMAENEMAESETAESDSAAVVKPDEVAAAEAVVDEAIEREAIEAETVESETAAADEVVAEAAEVEVESAKEDEVVAEAAEVEVESAKEDAVEADAAKPEESDRPAKSETAEGDDKKGEPERVVRVLSVGMEVDGVVKRTTDFGAFVDIGVGRDGLIHISELSTRRVAKVTDVLKQGQEVTAWIKELDRSRNRISLTLISPGTKTIRDLEKDEIVSGTVTRIVPYGAFVDIGVGRDALLHIREMADGYVNKPEDVVQVGEAVEARIIEVSRRRGRIDLSMKGLGPEPEAEQAAVVEPEDEGEPEDPFENMEVLSPMELAFQKAMTEGDEEVEGVTRRRSKRVRREQIRSLQDEIISRTLKSGGPR